MYSVGPQFCLGWQTIEVSMQHFLQASCVCCVCCHMITSIKLFPSPCIAGHVLGLQNTAMHGLETW